MSTRNITIRHVVRSLKEKTSIAFAIPVIRPPATTTTIDKKRALAKRRGGKKKTHRQG